MENQIKEIAAFLKKSKRTGFQSYLNYNLFRIWMRLTHYEKKPTYIKKDTKKIFFWVRDKKGVIEMRAKQPGYVLKQRGFDPKIYVKKLPDDVEGSAVIFVKYFPFFSVLKAIRKKCLIIFDIVDNSNPHLLEIEGKIADAIMFTNKRMENDFKKELCPYTKSFVSYHNWGFELERKDGGPDKFSLAYFGVLPDVNALFHKDIPELKIFEKFGDHVKNKENFNCFYSMRKEGSFNFLYKPSTKVSTAASMNSNIITSREPSAVELLGEDYPYLTNANREDVMKTLAYAKKTFGGPVWKKGLETMKKVKEKTDMKTLVNDYIDIIKTFEKK